MENVHCKLRPALIEVSRTATEIRFKTEKMRISVVCSEEGGAWEFDAGDLGLESLGRIVQLSVTLRNVCPNRRVALAAILTEMDDEGMEYKRGMKTVLIPAHTRETCRDVTVRCMKFVLPESLDVSGAENAICNARNFKARFIANYIDNGFECCDVVL
jgi:hypothetical protein